MALAVWCEAKAKLPSLPKPHLNILDIVGEINNGALPRSGLGSLCGYVLEPMEQ